jgi:hypothetical protein
LSSFYAEESYAIGRYSRRSLRRPMKINLSERERKRSTGRLPPRPAESVPHRNTLGGGERGSLSRDARSPNTSSRVAHDFFTPPSRRSQGAQVQPTSLPRLLRTPRGRSTRRYAKHPRASDFSGPGKIVVLTGCGIFPVGPPGARARVASSARATPARARDSRGRVLARPSIARRARSRASRAARVPRNAGLLTCRVRFDEHPKAPSALKAPSRSKRDKRWFGSRVLSPGSFPFATFRISRKDPCERKPQRKLLVSPRIKRSFASRSTRSAFLDPRGTRFSRRSFS